MRLIVGFLILMGCSSAPLKTVSRENMFPLGTYQHSIKLDIKGQPTYRFNGVVRILEPQITVVGLSHFGATIFKVEEDRKTGKVQAEIFQSQLKSYEPKVLELYKVMRALFGVKAHAHDERELKVIKEDENGRPVEVALKDTSIHFSEFDSREIPMMTEIVTPHFRVEVKVDSYDILAS